jgi:DNA-binding NarL/FixJ family response regulator
VPAITIIEDHALLAESLVLSLRQHGVHAHAVPIRPAPQLLGAALASRPDLVLLDLDLAECGDGASLVAPLRAAGVNTLIVTGITDRLRIAAALERGALGYQPKAAGLDSLLDATLRALEGSADPDEAERHALLAELAQHRARLARDERLRKQLTARERATLRALGEGRQVREIAAEWVVSEATVRTYVRGVLTKLGARSQLAAVALARRRGWF